jgi:hypothetical protein
MRYVEGFLLKGASVLAGVQRNLGWSTMSDTYQHNNGDVREPLACLSKGLDGNGAPTYAPEHLVAIIHVLIESTSWLQM